MIWEIVKIEPATIHIYYESGSIVTGEMQICGFKKKTFSFLF